MRTKNKNTKPAPIQDALSNSVVLACVESIATGHSTMNHHTQESFCAECGVNLDDGDDHTPDCLMLRAQGLMAALAKHSSPQLGDPVAQMKHIVTGVREFYLGLLARHLPGEAFDMARSGAATQAAFDGVAGMFLSLLEPEQAPPARLVAAPLPQGLVTDENGVMTYYGMLSHHAHGDASKILFLSSLTDPLAEVLSDNISYKNVTARYWITDTPMSKEAAQEGFIRQVMGDAKCDFGAHYSELTGYLWTDEEVVIGGHDLMAELHSFVGKWLILEIEIHGKKKR